MTVYYLRKIYREAGIRRKKIRKTKIVDQQQRARMKEQARVARDQLNALSENGHRIIYIDEICVTKSTIPTHEYSPRREPMEIDLKHFSNKTIAVIAGISATKGVEFAFTYEKSVNIEKFTHGKLKGDGGATPASRAFATIAWHAIPPKPATQKERLSAGNVHCVDWRDKPSLRGLFCLWIWQYRRSVAKRNEMSPLSICEDHPICIGTHQD